MGAVLVLVPSDAFHVFGFHPNFLDWSQQRLQDSQQLFNEMLRQSKTFVNITDRLGDMYVLISIPLVFFVLVTQPSTFAYPKKLEEKKEDKKERVTTAVLSTTAKAKVS